MAQLGMTLTGGDFRRLRGEPRAVLIQTGAPPLLAFALLQVASIVPLAAGMAARYFAPQVVVRIEPSSRRASIAIFLAMVLATFENAPAFRAHGLTLGPAMLALDIAAMGVAVALASACRLAR